jgi:uncharacterized membrane protein YfcA
MAKHEPVALVAASEVGPLAGLVMGFRVLAESPPRIVPGPRGTLAGWLRHLGAGRAAALVLSLSVAAACWHFAAAIAGHQEGAWTAGTAAGIVLLASLVSSIAGFAFSALAGSALAWLGMDALHAVQLMVLCSTASQLYAVWKIRESIRWAPLLPLMGGGLLTVPLGVWMLRHVDAAYYVFGLGLLVVAYGCYSVFRREHWVVRGNAWLDAAAGALGGISGGLAGFPGASVTIWCSLRGWDKVRQRAAYQPYILLMQVVALISLWWQVPARFTAGQDLPFVPLALIGAIGGMAVFRKLSNRQFQIWVSLLLVVSGVGLLARVI